ncbi:hypothetical protein TorRG33x02_254810 [Trema orientale]|uniref:Uncharacterized protein n=1 Tax=Trema orientale TaxID=63057 RepID=A0A2P5DD20_TREOI|nr:hypothetical protein TorRG33x02_254810 [Trema orientale]
MRDLVRAWRWYLRRRRRSLSMIWLWLNLSPREVRIRAKLGEVMVEEEGEECFETFRKVFRRRVSSDSVNSSRNRASEDGSDGDEGSLVLALSVDMANGMDF